MTKCRQFDNSRWLDDAELAQYEAAMKKEARQDLEMLAENARERVETIRDMRRYAESLPNSFALGKQEVAAKIKAFGEWTAKCWSNPYDYVVLNRFLPDEVVAEVNARVAGVEAQNEVLSILFGLDKTTDAREEKKALLQLALKAKNAGENERTPELQPDVAALANKFAHLGYYYFRGKPHDESVVRERLKHLLEKTAEELEKSLSEVARQERNADETQALEKQLGLDENTCRKIAVLKEYGYVSSIADEDYNFLVHRHAPLFKKLCREWGITWEEFAMLTPSEAAKAVAEGLQERMKPVLAQREQDHAVVLEEGAIRVLQWEELAEYRKKELKKEEPLHHLNELHGQSASPGKTEGTVKLVNGPQDVGKVLKGDVLVATSTNISYVPAMQRACAIVTNDGGLLCHAAIVSRELRIPCGVGTKVATRVFKDGDRVSVDAVNGIVKRMARDA